MSCEKILTIEKNCPRDFDRFTWFLECNVSVYVYVRLSSPLPVDGLYSNSVFTNSSIIGQCPANMSIIAKKKGVL
jgi:hypothetical protein